MLHWTEELFDQYDSSTLQDDQFVNQEIPNSWLLQYICHYKQYSMHNVVDYFIILVLSRFRANLQSIYWCKT